MDLQDKNAVITGSTGRLGSSIVLALAKMGCNCICHYNCNAQKAELLAAQIQSLGRKAVAVQADLTRPEQIEKLFKSCSDFGHVQILVNSAAVFSRQSLSDVTFETSQKVLSLNFTAPVMTSKYFAKLAADLPDEKKPVAKIINIVDVGGIRPWANCMIYCASKAALISATKAMAKELAPEICVNAIAPGIVTWPEGFDEAARKRQLSFIPSGRIADKVEIAAAIVHLLKNDYITGQVLNVDGGRCI